MATTKRIKPDEDCWFCRGTGTMNLGVARRPCSCIIKKRRPKK